MLAQVVNAGQYLINVIIPQVQAAGWKPDSNVNSAEELIKSVLNILLFIVVVSAVIFIMLAGLQYVSSQGDAAKAKTAMSGITNTIIGVVVSFAAYAIVSLIMTQVLKTPITTLPTV